MNKLGVLLFTILLSISVSAQHKTNNPKFDKMLNGLLSHTVKEVTPEDVCNNKEIIYLDAREKKEFKVSHIKNATWVGFNTFKLKKVKDIPKDKKIVVYCTVGYRSEKIAEQLIKAGYKDVSNLYGGIFEWVHKNQEVINKKGTTQEVHTYDSEWGQWLEKGIKKN
ncbi:rhodanese-like domain-containing protein [Wenyingzhuangia sp. IMCC45574]